MWDVFRRVIKRAFCKGDIKAQIAHKVKLDAPLGAWLPAERHIQYDFYRTNRYLFCRFEDPSPSLYERMEIEGEKNDFEPTGIAIKLPKDAHLTGLTEGSEGKYHPTTPFHFHPPLPPPIVEEEEEKLEATGVEDILQNAETLIAWSDGSYDAIARKAAFNWRIVDQDRNGLTTIIAPIMTSPKYLNSYRAEFAGIWSLVRFIKNRGLHQKKIKIHCDGKSCVDILRKGRTSTDADDLEKAEHDIIVAIFKIIEEFEDVTFEWVQGHQES
jgi:hypothetical protein